MALDHDARIQVARSALMIRTGIGWYSDRTKVDVSPQGEIDIRSTFISFTVAALARHDIERHGLWVGGGAQVVPYRTSTSFEGTPIDEHWEALIPAAALIAGYGYRIPGGEMAVELRGSTAYRFGAFLGYRLVY
jgi:hypothetical protein